MDKERPRDLMGRVADHLYKRNKAKLIADAVLKTDAQIRELASLPGVSTLAKAVFLQMGVRKMVLDINAIKARTWAMEQLHGRRIAVVEVLDECLLTEQAKALVRDAIGLDAIVVLIDALKVGDEPCTRIYVEHPRFAVVPLGEEPPLELRMRRKFCQDVRRG